MSQPTLSIIIPTWNTESVTARCVSSLKANPHSKNWEIIVVDNASTDGTFSSFSQRSDLTYLLQKSNSGYARACNAGARVARSDTFLFLNSDMELVAGLNQMLAYYRRTPSLGLVGPCLLNPDSSPQGSVFPPQSIKNAFLEFWLGQPAFSKYFPTSAKPLPVWAISGGAILIAKSVFNQLNGWDTRYHMYFEDLELCRRVRRLSLPIIYYPHCRFVHRHGASGNSLASPQNQWRRLIAGSRIYHGYLYHYLLNFIIWSGQKLSRFRHS